jgi:hypothetical protein
LSVAVSGSTTNVIVLVRNTTGATLTKGTAVYISGATGQNPTVSKAIATGDPTSAQTLGLMTADLANNTNGYVTVIGLITNIDTSAYTDGAQLYLSGTTAGTLTATKPYAPIHLVYAAVVEHAHPSQGKLFVKVQNGYEMDELHNVAAQSPTTGQTLVYNASNSLWEKNTVSLTAGVNGTLPVANGGTGITSFGTGVAAFLGTPSSANLASAVTDETGTGALVFATSPTLVTPALGTPSSATLTNATGLPISTGVSGLGTGVATFLATPSSANLLAAVSDETGTGALVFATSPTLVTPALGTPSALVGTNITGTASGLTAGNVTTNANLTGAVTSVGNATSLGSFTSAQLAGALTDETGSGANVFATSPTLVTPALGTPSALVGTNITGTAAGLTAGNVTTNANLTGAITSSGNATSLGSFTSAQLLAALTDETGTGANVFATSPTLVTPALGTPSALVGTNITGTAANFNINGTVGATTPNTGNFTTLTENSVAVVTQSDIGSAPNEIPLNQYLGSLAYQNGDAYYNTGMTVGFRNRIINGAMMISQRNATTAVSVGDPDAYPVDRTVVRCNTSGISATTQQSTTAPAGFKNSIVVNVTTGVTASASDRGYVSQKIEGYNFVDCGFGTTNAKSLTLSFWVRSSLTGTFSGCFENSNQDRSYVFTYSINSANTWEQKFITVAGDTTGTWVTDSGIGIYVLFDLGNGSSLKVSSAINTWIAGDYRGAVGSVAPFAVSGSSWYVTGVQLEKGNIATSFDVRPYGTELALCQRYFFKTYAQGVVPGASSTSGAPGRLIDATQNYASLQIFFPVTMRVAPSCVVYNPNTGTTSSLLGDGTNYAAAVTAIGVQNVTVYANNVSIGTSVGISAHITAASEL